MWNLKLRQRAWEPLGWVPLMSAHQRRLPISHICESPWRSPTPALSSCAQWFLGDQGLSWLLSSTNYPFPFKLTAVLSLTVMCHVATVQSVMDCMHSSGPLRVLPSGDVRPLGSCKFPVWCLHNVKIACRLQQCEAVLLTTTTKRGDAMVLKTFLRVVSWKSSKALLLHSNTEMLRVFRTAIQKTLPPLNFLYSLWRPGEQWALSSSFVVEQLLLAFGAILNICPYH